MKNLRFKLLLSLVIFSLVLVTVISYANRDILISNIEQQVAQNHKLIENHILTDMETVDNAHYYFDTNISSEMERELHILKEYYEQNKDVHSWDLQKLSASYEMDIYILDATNTVINTTFEQDLGLSFSECCSSFSMVLDERRNSNEYFTDGIDVSTTTGEIREFSYLATSDHQYLLELGVKLDEVPVFQKFNFKKTSNYLVEQYDDLIEVQTINTGGIFFDDSFDKRISIEDKTEEFQEYFKLAKSTMQPTEYIVNLNDGYQETHRFLPYAAETVHGESTSRVVYVKYGNNTELAALAQNTKQMIYVMVIALLTTLILLMVITKILSKTISLATYDPLTGAYNRAAYATKIEHLLRKRKGTLGLLLIDLDNFKQANDQYGHAVGDKVLIDTAEALKEVIDNKGFLVRLGGDEFGLVVYQANEAQLEILAKDILQKIRDFKYSQQQTDVWSHLSVSIGGAISTDPTEKEINLFVRADKALYNSKNAGKNQYSIVEIMK